MWADIVHWQYSNRFWPKESRFHRLDFALLRLLRKPVVVQFHGSDFRDNKKRIEGSPWWEEAFDAQTREELDRQAAQTQRDFAAADFTFALHYGMMPYVREENKDRVVLLERSVDVAKIKPRVKDDPASPIVIAHSPSNRQTKGTAHILDAIEKLKQKRELHFVLLADLPHDEVIERLAGADIVIDQIIGENYGLASVEALALGKAVVANIGKDMSEIFPSDLPIVSATPETLEAVLVDLIDDHETRIEIAKRGPAYALRRHSLEATMPQALEAYKQAAVRRGRKKLAAQIDAIRKEHEKRSVSDAGRNEGKP
jgi:glycosyltransferase involved in cell wall biosynthesis